MAVADKITQLTEIRADIRDALVEQGIEDATTHNYIDFAEDILAIEGGGVVPITITADTYDMNTTDAYMTENAGKFIISSRIREVPAGTESIVLIPNNYYKSYPGEPLYAYSHAPTPLTLLSAVHLAPHNLLDNTTDFDAVCLPYGSYATISSGSSLPIVMDPDRWYNTFDLSCTVFKTAQVVNLNGQSFPFELARGKAAYNNSSAPLYVVDSLISDDWIDVAIDDADFVANNSVYFQIPVTEDIYKTIDAVKQVIIYWEGTSDDYSLYHWWDNKMGSSAAAITGWEELALYQATPAITKVGSVLSTAGGAARLRPVVISGTAGSPWLELVLGQICFTLKLGNATWLNRHSNSFKLKVLF